MMFCKISIHNYENPCLLNILGVEERHIKDDGRVYDEFKEKLDHNSLGWDKEVLLWERKYPLLPINLRV